LRQFKDKDRHLMLAGLRKYRQGLARIVLVLFVSGLLNLVVQPCLMAATLNDCHETSTQFHKAGLTQVVTDADCIYCPVNEPVTEDFDLSFTEACMSTGPYADGQQLAMINVAERDQPILAEYGAPASPDREDLPDDRLNVYTRSGAPPPSLNIRYCRFLI